MFFFFWVKFKTTIFIFDSSVGRILINFWLFLSFSNSATTISSKTLNYSSTIAIDYWNNNYCSENNVENNDDVNYNSYNYAATNRPVF